MANNQKITVDNISGLYEDIQKGVVDFDRLQEANKLGLKALSDMHNRVIKSRKDPTLEESLTNKDGKPEDFYRGLNSFRMETMDKLKAEGGELNDVPIAGAMELMLWAKQVQNGYTRYPDAKGKVDIEEYAKAHGIDPKEMKRELMLQVQAAGVGMQLKETTHNFWFGAWALANAGNKDLAKKMIKDIGWIDSQQLQEIPGFNPRRASNFTKAWRDLQLNFEVEAGLEKKRQEEAKKKIPEPEEKKPPSTQKASADDMQGGETLQFGAEEKLKSGKLPAQFMAAAAPPPMQEMTINFSPAPVLKV